MDPQLVDVPPLGPRGPKDAPQTKTVRWLSPSYLTEADYPWLRALLDEHARFVGRRHREWRARVTEPLPVEAPRHKLATAVRVLDRLSQQRGVSPAEPRKIRATLFRAAKQHRDRSAALAATAAQLAISPQQLLDALFADLPDERPLSAQTEPLAPDRLAVLCNSEIVSSLLCKATQVRITAHGNVRAVVRHAKLVGLLCVVTPGNTKDEVVLEVSGPFALFRHTRIYGRALASLVPRLSWCNSYRLEADCVLDTRGSLGRFVLSAGDPVVPARELPAFDSKVEERFARDFAKLATDWDVIREPRALVVAGALVFPDFELHHRATGESWLLEIVGYWTPEYVRRKLAVLKEARIEHLIVCIDEARCCSDDEPALGAKVIRYRRKVDAAAVLEILNARPRLAA